MQRAIYPYMSVSPTTVSPELPAFNALELMRESDIRHLPVVDEGVLVGIVSERDLLFAERLGSTRSGLLTVSALMARDPFILQVDSSLSDAVRTMIRDKFGSAVVLDRGNVVGVFTTIDALRALLDRLGAEDV